MWDAGIDTAQIPLSILEPYCEADAYKCRVICESQINALRNKGMTKMFDVQMRWMDMLSYMETRGVGWDQAEAYRQLDKYKRHMAIVDGKLTKILEKYQVGNLKLDVGSKDDISALLYGGVLVRSEKRPKIKTKNIKTKVPYVFTYKNGKKVIKAHWVSHPDTRVIRMVYQDVEYNIKGFGIKPRNRSKVAKYTQAKPFYKVDKDTLPFLSPSTHEQKTTIQLLLKRAKIARIVSTFKGDKGTGLITKLGTDGRLHTNYNQALTATGRLSSSDPNSQNLPRSGTSPIKKCVIPLHKYIMNADLSQIELRVPAQLAHDQVMMREFINNEDLHANAATNLMKVKLTKLSRTHAKGFNFRMIYGGTEYGFHMDPKMPDFGLKRWAEIVKAFYNKYFGLADWQNKNIKHVIQGDGTLVLPTGRRFLFKLGFNGKYNERQIKNYPVQGIAGGDILPLAAIIIWDSMRKAGLKSEPILTVHDSIVFDVVAGESVRLAKIIDYVFNHLPGYIKSYYGINWIVPLPGDIERGLDYGDQKEYVW
jgi:DNA polymerase I-like protein with 3'-5' exonuclease and polymerase domains